MAPVSEYRVDRSRHIFTRCPRRATRCAGNFISPRLGKFVREQIQIMSCKFQILQEIWPDANVHLSTFCDEIIIEVCGKDDFISDVMLCQELQTLRSVSMRWGGGERSPRKTHKSIDCVRDIERWIFFVVSVKQFFRKRTSRGMVTYWNYDHIK